MELTRRRGRRRNQVVGDLKETGRKLEMKRKHKLSFPVELALEEAVDLT
jgi:hypothetical protein